MDNLTKVEGYGQVKKDLSNSAVVNVDVNAFNSFKNRRLKEQEQESRINKLETKLANVESLLEKILDKL